MFITQLLPPLRSIDIHENVNFSTYYEICASDENAAQSYKVCHYCGVTLRSRTSRTRVVCKTPTSSRSLRRS